MRAAQYWAIVIAAVAPLTKHPHVGSVRGIIFDHLLKTDPNID